MTGESDSLPEFRSPVRTHLFSLNHCIWYSSATAIHPILYLLQRSAMIPHNSSLCLGMAVQGVCDSSEADLHHGRQHKFVLKLGREGNVHTRSGEKEQ